jgi:hypothetical protein
MSKTPDRFPGEREEDEIVLEADAVDPTVAGALRFNGTTFRFRDAAGVFDPAVGAGGLSSEGHKILRQLIHFIDSGPAEGFASGAFEEILPAANPFPTSYIWWESAAKLKKILELAVTRNANQTPATEAWKMYDTDGSTVLVTITDTWSYSGIFPLSRTRAIT